MHHHHSLTCMLCCGSVAMSSSSLSISMNNYSIETTGISTCKDEKVDMMLEIEAPLRSRLLYPNPVCLLCVNTPLTTTTTTTQAESEVRETTHRLHIDGGHHPCNRNVMTITWLTAINNKGTFVASINRRRFTASLFTDTSNALTRFVLCVPTADMVELVRRIGGCSGRDGDKLTTLGAVAVPLSMQCADGCLSSSNNRKKKERFSIGDSDFIVEGCVAAMLCQVINNPSVNGGFEGDEGDHIQLIARVERAFVRSSYWDGKTFSPSSNSGVSPLLTFLGSGRFGVVQRLNELIGD